MCDKSGWLLRIVLLGGLSVLLGASLVYTAHWRVSGQRPQRANGKESYALVRVFDATGRPLASLFEGLPVDPRFPRYAKPPSVSQGCGRAASPKRRSVWSSLLPLLGLSFEGPVVHAQACDCGETPVYDSCAPVCEGMYWVGETEPSDDPHLGFFIAGLVCKNNSGQCPGESATPTCWCDISQ